MLENNQTNIFDYIERQYPHNAGFKSGDTSEQAAKVWVAR